MSAREATAIHEAGHAVTSHILGVLFDYAEVSSDHEGVMMPFFSPCPTCGSTVPEHKACQPCLEHYEKHRPSRDARSDQIERFYREEGAVAIAGELAELRLTGQISDDEEVAWDRSKAKTRVSLRHLYHGTCLNYCGRNDPCTSCDEGSAELRRSVDDLLSDPVVWSATQELARQLASGTRMSGADIASLLEQEGYRGPKTQQRLRRATRISRAVSVLPLASNLLGIL